MRTWMLRFFLPVLLAPTARTPAEGQEAALAWFTGADVPDSVISPEPADRLPAAPGTVGEGVRLTRAVALDAPLLSQESGMISFWIQPAWDGDDRKTHRILRIGDPETNGLLVEKADTGMLRFVMASPVKITAARGDVSSWRAGEWHHVVAAWTGRKGKPLGLPLWIDRNAVAGPVAGGNTFLDPAAMTDRRLWLGSSSAEAVVDELIMRRTLSTDLSRDALQLVYRDYFRTAPYRRIEIDPEPLRVSADRRVVNGQEKQFGLKAGDGSWMEPVTDFAVRYGQWAHFDAKPFIRWRTSDPGIATVDENGRVTGRDIGSCRLLAEFRGLEDGCSIEVISAARPDLDLIRVARLPRYAVDGAKWFPDEGEIVRSVARIENFGYETAPNGIPVRFELIPDADRDFRLDPDEKAVLIEEKTIDGPLAPREGREIAFSWAWTLDPLWVRVTVDPQDGVDEICEANNQRCELNIARPMHFGYEPATLDACHQESRINHIGSFSYFDWLNGQADRFRVMLREAVWPTTGPDGVLDDLRTDRFHAIQSVKWEDEPFERERKDYDGGFPVREKVDLMAVDAAILHEFGHTCMALPDLYGYPVSPWSVLLRDELGRYYAGGDLLPEIRDDTLPLPSCNNVPCGAGYNSLMNFCHLWLHPVHAGQIQHFAGYRGERFWGVQGRLIPTREHVLKVFDVNDRPLPGAAVYTYHVNQTRARDASTKYFHDRPKFIGRTDPDGLYVYPGETDPDWDDPDTDEVEGRYAVWNPFGRAQRKGQRSLDVAFTPNVWEVQGLLLLKIVSGEQTEFAWLPLTEFNQAYFRGERIRGVYEIRTSLAPSAAPAPIVRPQIPEAIRRINLAPVAEAPQELTVQCGEAFTIDGSGSRDPEGQPLIYRWKLRRGHADPRRSDGPVYQGLAPRNPGDIDFTFYVIDGLRVSDPLEIRVHVQPGPDQVILATSRERPVAWRYTVREPGPDWADPAFDDTEWEEAPGGFGARNPPGSVIRTPWETPHIWLRRQVDIPGDRLKNLSLLVYHDEDLEVYINGVLAAKRPGSRTVYERLPITAEARSALKPGRNLVAVHCLNSSGGQYIDLGIVDMD